MPDGFDIHIKTADEAITLLQTGKATLISLDHDLGQEKTGYDVAKWMEENAANGVLKEAKIQPLWCDRMGYPCL
jgi:hypothetical protein